MELLDIGSEKNVGRIIEKLEKLSLRTLQQKKYEKTLECMSAKARIQYIYNQEYADFLIETKLLEYAKCTQLCINHVKDDSKVMFYDGFGMDVRGLAYIYLNAIIKLGYHIIYVTEACSRDKQPEIMKMLENERCTIYHSPLKMNYTEKIGWLKAISEKEAFGTAFLYTTPWDVAGIVAFNELANKCVRYQVNLTDHAFWLGVNAFDFCIEFRNYGASISHYYRGIEWERLVELPYYPVINEDIIYQGLPFELDGKKLIFSGGSLYKTLDSSNSYYRAIDALIQKHEDIVFLYAGSGDKTKINELINKYPEKIYCIQERNDLLQIMKRAHIYMNTYPISGALMLQYAATANCIPVTLKRPWDDDVSGILLDEEALGTTFSNIDEFINEMDKLITDREYWSEKKSRLNNQVITEKEFIATLDKIIKEPVARYDDMNKQVDTVLFRKYYLDSIKGKDIVAALVNRKNNHIVIGFFDFLVIALLYVVEELKRWIDGKKAIE